MVRVVVLKFGNGNWQQGFPTVIAQVWDADLSASVQFAGSLPPAPELAECYAQWRSLYQALSGKLNGSQSAATRGAIEIEPDGVTNVSRAAFNQLCQQLKHQLERWLDATSFSKIERRLRTKLASSDAIQCIVETDDRQLRRFPWHLWSFFDDYPNAEVALSAPEYGRVEASRPVSSSQIRILAILGNSRGIDVQKDRIVLGQLPNAETAFLVEPQRQELDQRLWDEQGWDILFFAGHSASHAEGAVGELAINQTDWLTVDQLKNALRAAIARGLKMAILNSCDGLGLAWAMADLNIPQLVVMREPVPDPVAQEFVKHLLTAYANGQSFYASVRQAREKLQGLEDQFPCASWLPVICQNPAEVPPSWQELLGASKPSATPAQVKNPPFGVGHGRGRSVMPKRPRWQARWQVGVLTSVMITSLVMGVRFLGGLQAWELSLFDHLLRLRPGEGTDPRILVVEVTQADTSEYGYPLEDATLAQLIQTLEQFHPSAIGVDMHRHAPRGQGRAALMGEFQRQQNLVTVCWAGSADKNYAPPPEFSEAQLVNQVGFSDLAVDGQTTQSGTIRDDVIPDGLFSQTNAVIRRQLLSYDPRFASFPSSCTTPYGLSLQLAFRFLSHADIQPLAVNQNGEWQFGPIAFKKLTPRFGGYQQLNGLSSQILINYRSDPPGQRVTLQQVLHHQINRSSVENRVVLIGTTAAIARDSFMTPYGEMAGVWIHAHAVSQMLSAVVDGRSLIWVLPQWHELQWGDTLWVLAWASVGGLLAWRFRSCLVLALTTGITALVLYQICLVILIQGGWMPLLPSLLALVLTSGIAHTVIVLDIWRSV
jgi:CHASE2 domain-containing sensor protein